MTRRRGMTLIECLAAFVLLGIAMALASLLSGQVPRAAERLSARRAALRSTANVLEAVRAGAGPLVNGPVSGAPFSGSGTAAPRVTLTVRSEGQNGLYRVRAEAEILVRESVVHTELTTLIWRPQ